MKPEERRFQRRQLTRSQAYRLGLLGLLLCFGSIFLGLVIPSLAATDAVGLAIMGVRISGAILCSAACARLAAASGRSSITYGLLGFFLPPIGLLFAYLEKPSQDVFRDKAAATTPPEPAVIRVKCPSCMELVPVPNHSEGEVRCPSCQSPISFSASTKAISVEPAIKADEPKHEVICPNSLCGCAIPIQGPLSGQTRCPKCNASFDLSKVEPVPPMKFSVFCPNSQCGSKIEYQDERATQGRCPDCGAVFELAAARDVP